MFVTAWLDCRANFWKLVSRLNKVDGQPENLMRNLELATVPLARLATRTAALSTWQFSTLATGMIFQPLDWLPSTRKLHWSLGGVPSLPPPDHLLTSLSSTMMLSLSAIDERCRSRKEGMHWCRHPWPVPAGWLRCQGPTLASLIMPLACATWSATCMHLAIPNPCRAWGRRLHGCGGAPPPSMRLD
jgi:hypothetical protein